MIPYAVLAFVPIVGSLALVVAPTADGVLARVERLGPGVAGASGAKLGETPLLLTRVDLRVDMMRWMVIAAG